MSFTSAGVDSAGNGISHWNWTFGDGSTSTVQNPSNTYTTNGTFSLALVATNNLGETVTGSGPASIVVAEAAQVQFTFTNTNGSITITGFTNTGPGGAVIIPSLIDGLPVTSIGDEALADFFTMTSVLIPGSVTNIGVDAFAYCTGLRLVYFEGNEPNFPLAGFSMGNYSATGYYLPGTTNWAGVYVDGVPVVELPSIGIIANPTNGAVPLSVSFTAAAIDSASNTINNWNWTFGDGSTSTAQRPSHTYTNSGTYSVALFETNNIGGLVPAQARPSWCPRSRLRLPPVQRSAIFHSL